MLTLRVFILMVAVALFSHAAAPAKPTAASKAKAARATLSDPELEKAIRAKLTKSKISTDKFTVRVQGGVATLAGHTDVVQHKGTATRLAKNAGALAVVNNIEISQAAKDKAVKNLESGRRRAQVKRTETVARSK
jgi:osmotically-inducible protein OsmY